MEIIPGTVVRSTAGHDKGDLLLVIAVDKNFALLIDGRGRRTEKPKKKNLRHLKVIKQRAQGITERMAAGEKISAAEIRKALSQIASETAVI